MKKVLIGLAITLVLTSAFVGCSKKPNASGTETIVPDIETQVKGIEDCILTEEEMAKTVNAYVEALNIELKKENIVAHVDVHTDGKVSFDGTKTMDDGSVKLMPGLFEFSSMKDAFAYLYENGQTTIDGILTVEMIQNTPPEAPSIPTESDTDKTASQSSENSEKTPDTKPTAEPTAKSATNSGL